ncbi:MAG: hypothetical protein U0271_35630 [Polyangiaceae bacterium]
MATYRDSSSVEESQYVLAAKGRMERWLVAAGVVALGLCVGSFTVGVVYGMLTGFFWDGPFLFGAVLSALLVPVLPRLRSAAARSRAIATTSGARLDAFTESLDPRQLYLPWEDILGVDVARESVPFLAGMTSPFIRTCLRIQTRAGAQSISLSAFGCNEWMLLRRILRARSQGVDSLAPSAEQVRTQRLRFAKPRTLRGDRWWYPNIVLTTQGISIGRRRIDWCRVTASHVISIPPLAGGGTRVHLELADGESIVLRAGYDTEEDRLEELIAPQYCARDTSFLTPSTEPALESADRDTQ